MSSEDLVPLSRDCEAVLIPSGIPTTLSKGTSVSITQSLGGAYTVLYSGGLARIDGRDADALGKEVQTPSIASSGIPPLVDEGIIYQQLRQVYDPEIPVNIVDLGLVYEVRITPHDSGHQVLVNMTLTAPGCGMGPAIAADAKKRILEIPGVTQADVELVWDPPWNQNMVSEVGRMQLGWV